MIRPLFPAMLAAALLAGGASGRTRETPIATPVGKSVNCLALSDIRETRVRDDRTIDFYTRSRQVYRNVLPYQCPQLGFEEAFGYATSLPHLCSTDIITVVPHGSGIRGASCGLGHFQPVTIAGERADGAARQGGGAVR